VVSFAAACDEAIASRDENSSHLYSFVALGVHFRSPVRTMTSPMDSDRTLLDVQYSHVGGNFILDFHDPSLADVQPTLIVAGTINGRSGTQSVNIRPTNSVTANMNYFMPGRLWGDHAFKIGGYWRDNYARTISVTGGHATARFPTSVSNDCAALAAANPNDVTRWCAANLTRDGDTIYKLANISAYVQDTLTHGRATFQLGVRYDYNHDKALAGSISANPILPEWLPAISSNGVDPSVRFHDVSPRLGLTYDLGGNGKTIAHANFARYFGQVGTGGISGQVNPVTAASVRFPWNDANGDKVIQANEVLTGLANVLNFTAVPRGDPARPPRDEDIKHRAAIAIHRDHGDRRDRGPVSCSWRAGLRPASGGVAIREMQAAWTQMRVASPGSRLLLPRAARHHEQLSAAAYSVVFAAVLVARVCIGAVRVFRADAVRRDRLCASLSASVTLW
jgi:hypothetical protein